MQHHRLVLFPFRLIFLRSFLSDFICFICRHSKLIWFIPRFMPVSAENYSFTYLMLLNILRINIHVQLIIDSAVCRNVTIRHFLFHNSIQIQTCEFIFNSMVQLDITLRTPIQPMIQFNLVSQYPTVSKYSRYLM